MISYSTINKSQLEGALRLDAEYYQEEYLEVEKQLNLINTVKISKISKSVVNFGAYSLCNYIEWQYKGIPYINVGDVKEGFVDFSHVKYISQEVSHILKKSIVKNGDVILTMAGSIGNIAVAHNFPSEVNSNQATAKISLKPDFSPYFLTAFFLSKYGQNQIKRQIVSSVQPNIFLFQIKSFLVPDVSTQKQKEVESLVVDYLDAIECSKKYQAGAEKLLLQELGFKDIELDDELSFIINASDVAKEGRLDAEYSQPKYKLIIDKICKNYPRKLGDLVFIKKGFEPGSDAYQEEGKTFIRVSNLTKFGFSDGNQQYLSEETYKKLKDNFNPQAGEILLSKDATPGIAYCIKEPIDGIISGGILRLKTNGKINSEYLSLVINSIVGQAQAERDAGGSVIAHWKPEQIKNMLIPVLPMSTQEKIADLVKKSHGARKNSKRLLEEAKRKVEELIEKG